MKYLPLLLLLLLFIPNRNQRHSNSLIKVDTVRSVVTRYKFDSVYVYQTDTMSLLDTLKMRDTVYILKDWATPKTFTNTYSDSNYTLTVKDSIQFNALQSQSIKIETYNKTISKSELWVIYQTPITPSILYRHKSGVMVSAGYDILNGPVFGVGLRIR